MGIRQRSILLSVLLATLAWSGSALAVLDIQITGPQEGEIPVAIVPFQWDGPPGRGPRDDIAKIIQADLARTGRFKLINEALFRERPARSSEVVVDNWLASGAEYLVIGQVRPSAGGQYVVRFELLDLYNKLSRSTSQPEIPPQPGVEVADDDGVQAGGPAARQAGRLAGYNWPASDKTMRKVAHIFSDIIYEKLTGERGAFSTRIAYVTATGQGKAKRYALKVADADGHGPRLLRSSSQPIMSPSWSPNGSQIAYVSFEHKRSAIYTQELATGKRRRVSFRAGVNGAPSWSPDGQRLALTLSYKGNLDVYVMDLATLRLRQLTDSSGIDTEPAWSPDGRWIAFTSNRSGGPQLYRVPSTGGRAERLTFEGRYNARAAWSPDGKSIAMVHGTGRGYQIALMELDNREEVKVLTEGSLDESPSFAPNGGMILYAASAGRRGVLAAISVDGRASQRLVLQEGDVREPAWGPFTEKRGDIR